MPVYEYHCGQCKAKFDKLVRSGSPDEEITCPTCGSTQIDRKFSLLGFLGGSKNSGTPEKSKNCSPRVG